MTSARKTGRARARAGKKNTAQSAEARDIWARTQLLVEVLLGVMETEIQKTGSKKRSEQWLKLFGARDSAVVNLQKLVQLLAELQTQCAPVAKAEQAAVAPVSEEELAILSEWLKTNAANASTAAE